MKTLELERAPQTHAPHPGTATAVSPPGIAGLDACTEDARAAALDADRGPAEPAGYRSLLSRLEAAQDKIAPLYRQAMLIPFLNSLRKMGEPGFNQILWDDPERAGLAGLLLDIAQALLQEGESFDPHPTDAFEEVVTDLYAGFLGAESRQGVKPPDRGVIPPMVKWGNPDFGPYTWPVDATVTFDCKAAVVSLPPANARKGLLAWAALGHETAGHDIVHADTGLADELAAAVHLSLRPLGPRLARYWSARIDETSADVLGILNLGPAAGIGLIGYFRGLNAAFTGEARLRSQGPEDDPHPADILRGYLAAETVALLEFSGHRAWSAVIAGQTDLDAGDIILAGQSVSLATARRSAKAVAQTLVGYRAKALETHALGEIQNWTDRDETIVNLLRDNLRNSPPLPFGKGERRGEESLPLPIRSGEGQGEGLLWGRGQGSFKFAAAHVVAAAVTQALSDATGLHALFLSMLGLLNTLHDRNPPLKPLFTPQARKLTRNWVYYRQPTTA